MSEAEDPNPIIDVRENTVFHVIARTLLLNCLEQCSAHDLSLGEQFGLVFTDALIMGMAMGISNPDHADEILKAVVGEEKFKADIDGAYLMMQAVQTRLDEEKEKANAGEAK